MSSIRCTGDIVAAFAARSLGDARVARLPLELVTSVLRLEHRNS